MDSYLCSSSLFSSTPPWEGKRSEHTDFLTGGGDNHAGWGGGCPTHPPDRVGGMRVLGAFQSTDSAPTKAHVLNLVSFTHHIFIDAMLCISLQFPFY